MAAILTGTYDPQKMICSVAGVTLSGFSDGDMIIARRSEDMSFMRVGGDGSVARARNANKTGEFEFRLLQTSNVNAQLSALFAIDNLGNDGVIDVPITIADLSGFSLCTATSAWLKSIPEGTFGKEISERVWIFSAADLIIFHGGN